MHIENVSDTARWVAYYRAVESQRPDALFHDPFALRLGGSQAEAIARALPNTGATSRAIIVRTVLLDEMILDRVKVHGADLVINLAAGLDSRPWRMALPPTLHWVDVDLPGILNYKTETLRDEKTACNYEAIPADLTVPGVADAIFARLGAAHRRVLVITEGLLIYLLPEHVAALARALHAPESFRWWLTDLASPRLLRYIGQSYGKHLSNAPFRFGPAEGTEFFRPFGWQEESFRSIMLEARRLGRPMPQDRVFRLLSLIMSAKRIEEVHRMSGIVLLTRSEE